MKELKYLYGEGISKVRAQYVIIVCLILISCDGVNSEASIFFEDCTCDKIDFTSGFPVVDSLQQYTVNIPDSSWNPLRTLDGKYSMITYGKSLKGGNSLISTNVSQFQPPWNQVEENRIFRDENRVIAQRTRDSLNWYIVEEDAQSAMTIFVSYIDDQRNLHVATTLMTTDSLEPKVRICELENVLKTIRILEKETAFSTR